MITPMDTRILVKVPKVEKVTSGGIILPEDTLEREEMSQVRAEVVAIGEWAFPDIRYAPDIGDIVFISKYAGLLYTVDEVEYRVLDTASGASDVVAYESTLESKDLRKLRRKEEENE
jgi:co-chaperonin GroES (HSP10)